MGIHVIKMPDIGEGIAEVELVAWHVEVGQTIKEDQPLADVMTDKAAVEIPSPVTGKVIELGGRIGEMMAVGSELIRLEGEGDGNLKAGAPVRESKVATAPVASAPSQAVTDAPAESSAKPAAKHAPSEPRRAKPADHAEKAEPPRAALAPGERPLASPAVRQRAWDMGIELRYKHLIYRNGYS